MGWTWIFSYPGFVLWVVILYVTLTTMRYIEVGMEHDLPCLYFYSCSMLIACFYLCKLEDLELSADQDCAAKDCAAIRAKRARIICGFACLAFCVRMFDDVLVKRKTAESTLLGAFSVSAGVLAASVTFWRVFLGSLIHKIIL